MSPPTPTHRPIAVACAIPEELRHLRAHLDAGREERRGGRCFTATTLGGRPVLLTLCGVGMLSAAAATESLLIHYAPAAVLNYGCTGAHRADLLPGDLVVGARTIAYDSVRVDERGAERYAGMRYLKGCEPLKAEYLPAAPHLLDAAMLAAASLEGRHEPWPPALGWPDAEPHRAPRL